MSHVRYIDKTREYYRSEGYERAYTRAHFESIPFTPFRALAKPLSECRVGLVSSGDVMRCDVEPPPDDPRRLVYSLPADRYQRRKAAYDRYATTLEDVDSFLPLTQLRRLAAEGVIGGVAARLQVIASEYSQRKTLTVDAPEILRQMREDGVDVALLAAV
jgi:Glycine/sarcosine/betaine reductase selenoprotein B (GRDB)